MRSHELQGVAESLDKKKATRRIQKMLNTKFGANLDVDGVLGPLTLKSINKFMPDAKIGLADEPNKTTAVQGKQVKQQDEAANPAQQSAIAIAMKKAGKKPKDVAEERTEVKDKEGKVLSWKDDSNWKLSTDKEARGRVTNMSDKARRETEKLKKDQQGVAEGDKIGNMDTGAYDSAMARLKQLAGAGPLKTVYDPATRRYKNVPSAVQPVQQPKKK